LPCIKISYLKPTDACQTKASSKNITGIAGIMSTIGRKAVYGSGKADNKNSISIINLIEIKTREAKTFMVDEFGSKIPG
jgi:hypothetical protein